MNKISPSYGVPLQAFGYGHSMRQDCAYRHLISLPAFPAQENKENHKRGRFFRPLKAFFSLLLLLMLAGCSNEPKLPEPPISFPFSAWKAGERLDFQFRIKASGPYEFLIDIYHKKQDQEDRNRIHKLIGSGSRNKFGEVLNTGVPILLQFKLFREENGNERVIISQKFSKLELVGYDMNSFSKKVINLTLEPGNYRCQVESLSDISEFTGTEMKFVLAKHHAK